MFHDLDKYATEHFFTCLIIPNFQLNNQCDNWLASLPKQLHGLHDHNDDVREPPLQELPAWGPKALVTIDHA